MQRRKDDHDKKDNIIKDNIIKEDNINNVSKNNVSKETLSDKNAVNNMTMEGLVESPVKDPVESPMEDPFKKLPFEVLPNIFSNLEPIKVKSIFFTNRRFNAAVQAIDWMEKFERHFPSIFPVILKKYNIPFGPTQITDIPWLYEFMMTDKEEYHHFSEIERKLIFLFKEGNYEYFYDNKGIPIEMPPLEWLNKCDNNGRGRSILSWVLRLANNQVAKQINKQRIALELEYEYLAQVLEDKHISQALESLRNYIKLHPINTAAQH